MKKVILVLVFVLVLATAFLLVARPVQAGDSRQIVFAMKGGRFSRLEITGYNQNHREVTWRMTGSRQIVVTTGWWWQDFVSITWDNGGCQIEGLWGDGDFALITATRGQNGCSGASGNAYDPAKRYINAWINGIYWKDDLWGDTVIGRLDSAKDSVECMGGLAMGLITPGCLGVAQNALDDIIKNAPRP